jgi:tetratricopeptide (TPR) repeat protein
VIPLAAQTNSLEGQWNNAVNDEAQGKFHDAIQILNTLLVQIEHANSVYSTADENNRAIVLERLGTIYRETNRYQLADESFRKMLNLGDENAVRGYQEVIETYRESKEWQRATDVAEEAAKIYPSDRGLQIVAASQQADMGNPGPAIERVKAMLKGNPEDREVYVALAQMYTRVKDWDNAEKNIDKAIEVSSKQEDRNVALFLAGSIYERQKKYDKAEEEFDKVLADDPKNSMALNYLGYMLADRGMRLDEALGYLRRAVALDPQNSAYRDSLGWVYYKTGEYALAEENLRRASERLNNDPSIHDHLGELYQKTGRLNLAATQWECSLEEWNKTIPAEVDTDDVARVNKELETTIAQGAIPVDAPQAGSTACKELETTIAQGAFPADAPQAGSTALPSLRAQGPAGARSHPEWLPISDGDARKNLHKANEDRNEGVKEYDQGRYDKAAELLQAALPLYQRQRPRNYVFIMLGDSFERLGDFDNAYDAYILATPSVVPANRVVIAGLPDDRARNAAQSLLDNIQLCAPCLEQSRPYVGLAGIMRHFGRIAEAQAFEEEARIRKEADDAFHTHLNARPNDSLQSMCEDSAAVYERENRPALAEAVRAYAAQHEGDADSSIGSQANQSTLSLILQGLAVGMSGAMMARNAVPPIPQHVPMESRVPVQPNVPARQTAPSQAGNGRVSPNVPGERAPIPITTIPMPNYPPAAPSNGRSYPPPLGSNPPSNKGTAPPNGRTPAPALGNGPVPSSNPAPVGIPSSGVLSQGSNTSGSYGCTGHTANDPGICVGGAPNATTPSNSAQGIRYGASSMQYPITPLPSTAGQPTTEANLPASDASMGMLDKGGNLKQAYVGMTSDYSAVIDQNRSSCNATAQVTLLNSQPGGNGATLQLQASAQPNPSSPNLPTGCFELEYTIEATQRMANGDPGPAAGQTYHTKFTNASDTNTIELPIASTGSNDIDLIGWHVSGALCHAAYNCIAQASPEECAQLEDYKTNELPNQMMGLIKSYGITLLKRDQAVSLRSDLNQQVSDVTDTLFLDHLKIIEDEVIGLAPIFAPEGKLANLAVTLGPKPSLTSRDVMEFVVKPQQELQDAREALEQAVNGDYTKLLWSIAAHYSDVAALLKTLKNDATQIHDLRALRNQDGNKISSLQAAIDDYNNSLKGIMDQLHETQQVSQGIDMACGGSTANDLNQ